MKRKALFTSVAALLLGGMFSLSAVAQNTGAGTCADPFVWAPDASGAPTITGTTCGKETADVAFCNSTFNAPGPAFVIQAHFDSSRTFTDFGFVTTGAGYTPALYMTPVSGGCAANANCTATGDSTNPIPTGDVPNGDFYIIITAATFDGTGSCGEFTFVSDGTFPVELQSFDVI